MALHYDYHIRWKNFRGFRDTKWVRIAPLTLIIGANNSGKSSLLAPLILMQQTMQSRDPNTPLVTRGNYTDLGFYKDYVFGHDVNNDVEFSFRFHTHPRKKGVRLKEIGSYPPGMFTSVFSHNPEGRDLYLRDYELSDIYCRNMFTISRNHSGYDFGSNMAGELQDNEKQAIFQSRPINFLFSSSSALYNMSQDVDDTVDFEDDFSDGFVKYLRIASYAYEDIRRQFSRMFYIGPHREQPKRAYDYFGDEPGDVGKEGTHFAEILKNNQDNIVSKVNSWIKKINIGDKLEIDTLSGNMFSLNLVSGKGRFRHNIADLGFGISQVLPIIVQLTAASRSSLTIIEQPELHLNPAMQRRIADLLVQAAAEEKRVVVETHSEHIILRIRTLIADGKIDPSDVALYFVERKGSQSSVRQVAIDRMGHIVPDDWPKDFFSEKFDGAVELAMAQRKAKTSK